MKPLAIDLFCGLGGWAEGLLAEGWDVIGFDIERHVYGEHRYPAQLVLQDVLMLHGSQFRSASLIVASPPCQEFSYMAMPWSLAKAKAAAIRADTTGKMLADLTALFDACFRIAGQASLAAGRRVPLIVENVRGAQPWVGGSRWNFGSYHLWGDVPALMPCIHAKRDHRKSPGESWNPQRPSYVADHSWKTAGHPNQRDGHAHTRHLTNPGEHGVKHHGSGAIWFDTGPASLPSASPRRKMASAMIARIPTPLARHIARVFRPC